MSSEAIVRFILAAVFFASGFAALGFQMVWGKMFSVGLGHEIPSVISTVSALFFGMSAGAAFLNRVIAESRRPQRLYALLELVAGVWGLASAFLIPLSSSLALKLIGLNPSAFRHWSIAFAVPCVVLFPSTFAMGATFPSMFKIASAWNKSSRVVGGIYGANTCGAVFGALVTAFVLMPGIPMNQALYLLSGVNLAIAVVVLKLPELDLGLSVPPAPQFPLRRQQKAELFLLGFLGIAFELWGTRMLSQVLENTIYTYATILSIFLTGLSAGGSFYQRFESARQLGPNRLIFLLLAAIGLAVVALVFSGAEYQALRGVFGDGRWAVFVAEVLTAASIFAAPTFLMGIIYSEFLQKVAYEEKSLGLASAYNTLGAAIAAPAALVFLFPLIGSKWVLMLIFCAYLWLARIRIRRRILLLAGAVAIALMLPSNFSVARESASELDWLKEGVMATVSVRRDNAGRRTLYVNHRFQMGGTGSTTAEQRHADIPLRLQRGPKRALFLGVGTGISMGAARFYEKLEVDGVELLPGVVEALPRFAPENGNPQFLANFKVYTADARRFVRCVERRYDVIVADLFNPAQDGVGLLYTEEHFRAVKDRLQPTGIFCQWLPLYQMDSRTLRSVIATFLTVFSHSHAFLLRFNVDTPVLGLIGSPSQMQWPLDPAVSGGALADHLREIGLADSLRLLGCYLGGSKELAEYAANAPLNRDAFPHLVFDAPDFSFRRDTPPYSSLTNLLAGIPVTIPGLASASGEFRDSLRSYIVARNKYLRGLVYEIEGRLSDAVSSYVEASRLNSEFTAGYARCISIASSLAAAQPKAAIAMLESIIEAQPERQLGRRLLNQIRSTAIP